MEFKKKRLAKLDKSLLQKHFKKNAIWKGIEAGQVANKYERVSKKLSGFEGSKIVSWQNGTLRLKAKSSTQKQEMAIKKEVLKEEFKKKGIEIKRIDILF